jgi:hypothetical protein
MAGVQELRAKVADSPELLEIVDQVDQTIQQNVNKVAALEKEVSNWSNKFADAVASRDKVKDVIKQELNIDEFSPEAVRSKLANFASEDAIAARDKQFSELKRLQPRNLIPYRVRFKNVMRN